MTTLNREDNAYESRRDLYYIVTDMLTGMTRREIPVGAGEIQVCIGHTIKRDEFGKISRVPVYETQIF